ncbi:MAG TPA: putative toxin-antitoxin system toxin component, PIN family [Lacipirellulaceae bacterium]
MKVVLDTNVIIAGFGTRGLCADVLNACLDRHSNVLSDQILAEVSKNLLSKFKLPTAQVKEILRFLRQRASIVVPANVPAEACRDASDLPILGTAVAAGADCLISGDQDLLKIQHYEKTAILSPRDFYESLR